MATKQTARPTLTREEREERAAALHATLTAQIETLRTSEGWLTYLKFARSFHAYSFNNQMLIWAQKPAATHVAGFTQWKEKGRQVRKGEQAVKIFGYATRTCEKAACPEPSDEHRHVYFPIVNVFDISQTDAVDGTEEPPTFTLDSDDGADVLATLTERLGCLGYTITTKPLAAPLSGYTRPGQQIVIAAHLSPADQLATLLHEAAHNLMSHVDALTPAEYRHHRGLCEVEAESAAYLAAGILNLDHAATAVPYLAGWTGDNLDLITTTARRVTTTAAQLAALITEGTTPTHLPSPLTTDTQAA